eukprot:TRINITY_DN5110_c0_g1_i7.p1 TRINITY_DN5110_c0_g1~~TRINITY_DN5110_c0_g1_i7.p1  ORF type:complete len:784 (+),score=355.99 TRINITY_DN5110_c0_g1_i7:218-2353(+)
MEDLDGTLFAIEELKNRGNVDEDKIFICLSDVLSWQRTIPYAEEDEDPVIHEEEFKRRKAHPEYQANKDVEKVVAKARSETLLTYVVGAGLVYGQEESMLHYYFRDAWEGNSESLPIIGDGENFVPTIHVKDLAAAVLKVLNEQPKTKYILAVDEGRNTQAEIIQSIADTLGTGKVRNISVEDAALIPQLSEHDVHLLCVDLQLESGFIREVTEDEEGEPIEFEWHCEQGFVEGIAEVVQEYRVKRNLTPLKVFIEGPPASGKSYYAAKLAAEYKLHHIVVKDVVQQVLEEREDLLEEVLEEIEELAREAEEEAEAEARDKEEDEEDSDADMSSDDEGEDYEGEELIVPTEEEEDEEEEENEREGMLQGNEEGEEGEETGQEVEQGEETGEGTTIPAVPKSRIPQLADIPNQYLVLIMREVIGSNKCANQGYILDGFPTSLEQAQELFKYVIEEDEDGNVDVPEDFEEGQLDPRLVPDFVIVLEASDKFLRERVMDLSEEQVEGTNYNEEDMKRLLTEYRNRYDDSNEKTVVTFLDEQEAQILRVDVEQLSNQGQGVSTSSTLQTNGADKALVDDDEVVDPLFESMIKLIGAPHNYGPTKEEIEAKEQRKLEKEQLLEEHVQQEIARRDQEEEDERRKHNEEITMRLGEIEQQEREALEALSMPLRSYLVVNVLPTLSEGLIQVSKLRPQDPVDYLAEYLFKHNPSNSDLF